jgi:hypothetical protein
MNRVLIYSLIIGAFLSHYAGAEEWSTVRDIGHPSGNLSFSCRWQGEAGLQLKASPTDGDQEITFRFSRQEAQIETLPKDAFPPAVTESAQYDLDWLPTVATDVSVVLKFRQESWVFYINDRLAVVLPAPFMPPASIEQPITQAVEGNVRFQKTADFVFDDMFMVPEEEKNGLTAWAQESGKWTLHTAAQNAIERGDLKEGSRKVPAPDRSPNFYSLLGTGTNAVITAGHSFYDSYVLASAVKVVPGEMGLVFHDYKKGGRHGFTIQMEKDQPKVLCRLWKAEGADVAGREILGAVLLDLTPEQWIRLKVVTYQDRIQCYVDNTQVIDTHASLPPGGKFGLFATSSEGVQFDDVSARTHHRLDLSMVGGIRRHTIEQSGNFFPRRFFRLFAGLDTDRHLTVRKSGDPQWLILGSTAHKEHVFSAEFQSTDNDFEVGLIAGYTGKKDPYYRLRTQRRGNADLFVLERVSGKSVKKIEKAVFRVPAEPEGSRRSVSLMFDGSNGREMRFYRNNQLLMVHHADAAPSGGSGIYVAPGTRAKISNLVYDSRRENVYRSRFEKNEVFVDDGFMRHWSSPEGKWLPMTNGLVWHKSDFFGGFLLKMPFVPGSEIHLGVGEEGTNGVLVVSAEEDKLLLSSAGKVLTSVERKKLDEAPSRAKKGASVRIYTINYEDHWLWVTSGGEVLFKHAVAKPFKGRRIRLAGLTSDQLKDSHVERLRVKDYLFTESPFEWRVNGGQWSVVNRFFCQPKWSHMNGESKRNLAALWTKYEYGGDFCMEMYAGMRHEWYGRAGDLNMTIMASDTSPSKGYTITCTGWDPDHSQHYTKLYRNGKELASSDQYLVPRTREGLKRKGYNPLIGKATTRALHGAWFYMKLRRIGNRLEYYFDNELVFSADDPEPLNGGLAGIWTFMNSMMVARVKIAAEQIRPRPVKTTAVADATNFRLADLSQPVVDNTSLLKDEVPIFACSPSLWKAEDSVGRARLEWHRSDERPYFSIRNVLGSGNMLARCYLPHRPISAVAGWRFEMKRTDTAKFNFHFSVGNLKDGEYVAADNFFYKLSGTDFSEGRYRKVGESRIPGVAENGQDWHGRGGWTIVTVWVPPEILREYSKKDMYIQVEGFGIGQPCYELEGLRGNVPGAGYAVRSFTEIGFQTPMFTAGKDGFSSLIAKNGIEETSFTKLEAVQKWANNLSDPGLIAASLSVKGPNITDTADVLWVNMPKIPQVTCKWSETEVGTIEIARTNSWPDQRFMLAEVGIADTLLTPHFEGTDLLKVMVPREEQFLAKDGVEVPIDVHMGSNTVSFGLAWKDSPLAGRPVLLDIDGAVGFFESFEGQAVGQAKDRTLTINRIKSRSRGKNARGRNRAVLDRSRWRKRKTPDVAIGTLGGDTGGRYLEVANGGHASRLRTEFGVPVSLSRFPLFGFRYQGTGMVHVSLAPFHDKAAVKLSEPFGSAVPLAEPLKLDNNWHFWLGDISKVVKGENIGGNPFEMSRLRFGSLSSKDQTGLFSRWRIDDLVLGPAVSSPEQMIFSANYFEFEGVESVRVSVRQGMTAFADLSEKDKEVLQWKSFKDANEIAPDFGDLKDGLCRMFIQAQGNNGLDSEVTEIPFLLDRTAPDCAFSLEKEDDPACNGTMLKVSFKSSGDHAPLDLEKMVVKCGDATSKLSLKSPRARFEQRGRVDFLYLNWPRMFRRQLDNTTNGQVVKIVLAGIADGAGNEAPNLIMPITMDYSKDDIPPTILSLKEPENILWHLDCKKEGFTAGNNNVTTVIVPDDEEPYIESKTHNGKGSLLRETSKLKWSVIDHPYLSFRVRQPSITASNKVSLDLIVEFEKKEKAIIGLTDVGDEEDRVMLPDPILWDSSKWHQVSIDLPELLKGSVGERILKTKHVKSLTFQRSGAGKKKDQQVSLELQSVCIYRAWGPDDTVGFDAYDASGMAGVAVQEEYNTGKQEIAPVKSREKDARWIAVRARDKAGNVTRPYRYSITE